MTINTTQENNIQDSNRHKHYQKVMGRKLFESLSPEEKNEFIKQIDSVEEDLKHKDTIKLRVKPRIINNLCKLSGVHDIRGGAYRGDTIYLGHQADLFNKELPSHESIHASQQREISKIRLLGFIKRLIKTQIDGGKIKPNLKGNEYAVYIATTLTPLELEAYANQHDKEYLKNRKAFAYKDYEGEAGREKAFKQISQSSNEKAKKELAQKPLSPKIIHDLKRLEEIIDQTKDSEREMMWVFNDVDKVIEVKSVISVLKAKLDLLTKTNDKNQKKYQKLKEKYNREINNQNLNYFFEDEFDDKKQILEKIKELEKAAFDYRKREIHLWLEAKNTKNQEGIQMAIPLQKND